MDAFILVFYVWDMYGIYLIYILDTDAVLHLHCIFVDHCYSRERWNIVVSSAANVDLGDIEFRNPDSDT